jgi:hypothetical protein
MPPVDPPILGPHGEPIIPPNGAHVRADDGGWGPWLRANMTWHNVERLAFLLVSLYTAVQATRVKSDQEKIKETQETVVKTTDDAAKKAEVAAVKAETAADLGAKNHERVKRIEATTNDLWMEGAEPVPPTPKKKGPGPSTLKDDG